MDLNWGSPIDLFTANSVDIFLIKLRSVSLPLNLETASLGAGTAYIIYPNPAGSLITIQSSEWNENADVKVFNSSGQLVLTQHYGNNLTVELGLDVPNGIYLVTIENGRGVKVQQKIVKQAN